MVSLGDVIDSIGTFFNLPEIGLSEAAAGGKKTSNTGRVDINRGLSNAISTGPLSVGGHSPNLTGAYDAAVALDPVKPPIPVDDTGTNGSGVTGATNSNTVIGGGGVGPSQIEINALMNAISQTDTVRDNRNAQAQNDFQKAMDAYSAQNAIDRARHEDQLAQNDSTMTRNRQQSLLSSAQGSRGLSQVLAALGALGGTGSILANRAVAQQANQDLGNAQDVFNANAKSLTDSWVDAEGQQRQREEDARNKLQALRQNNENARLTDQQSIFNQLAGLYGAGTSGYSQNIARAAALQPQITQTTNPIDSRFVGANSTYAPAALKNYLAGIGDMSVKTQGGGGSSNIPINSPLFAVSDKRREGQLV